MELGNQSHDDFAFFTLTQLVVEWVVGDTAWFGGVLGVLWELV